MIREEFDIFRGWQAAQKKLPFDPDASPEWLEGYAIWLNTLANKKREQSASPIRVSTPPRRN